MTEKLIYVKKRNGTKELLDLEKWHQMLTWACDGIYGVSISDIEMKSKIHFVDGITTKQITNTSIKSAADLISEETPNYQYVAARLMIMDLRKQLFGKFEPNHLLDIVKKNIQRNAYDSNLLEWYSEDDFNEMNGVIKHDRDLDMTYAGMKQVFGKYLVQDRVSKEIFETPQIMYILCAATMFHKYPTETRMKYVKAFYDAISTFKISLPTPILAGVRTPQRQYSSCVLIESDDSLDSIVATTGAIVKYISQKAGIGIGASRIRAEGDSINNGRAVHTGVVPFYRLFQSAVKSCSQGSLRNGSATLFTAIWHFDIEDILVLKNNKGTEDNRVRKMDYGIMFNGYLHKRFLENKKITLFSPNDVPDLHEAFFNDQEKFAELYESYEKNTKIRKKAISARELYTMFAIERMETGRIYAVNIDHANTHSSFDEKVAPIHMSNLCVSGDTIITISTDDGDIKDIKIEELSTYFSNDEHVKVLSRNNSTGDVEFKNIQAFAQTSPKAKVMKITDDETGNYIIVTPEHKVYTKNRGYVKAMDLVETDILCIE